MPLDQDPKPSAKCTNDPPCGRRKGPKCDNCKAYNAWYQRERRRKDPERARRKDRFYRSLPERQEKKREYNARYTREKRAQIQAKRLETYWADPEAARAKARRYYYSTKYGITEEQRAALLEGECPICLKRPKAHVDHDHSNGEVRGGLCMTCNTHIGWLEDVGLDAVVRYLMK